MGNFLGIDWGFSKVGLSLADNETRMAFAFDTLDNDKNLFGKLAKIVKDESITSVVMGVPTVEFQKASFDSNEIGAKIEKELGVNVFYQNEMFTTKLAEKNLIKKDLKKIKRFDNQESARIILQDWLDKQ